MAIQEKKVFDQVQISVQQMGCAFVLVGHGPPVYTRRTPSVLAGWVITQKLV